MNKYLMRSFAFTYTKVFSALPAILLLSLSCTKIHFEPNPVPPVVVPAPPALTGQPNIILIVADDIGFEVPTFNGGQSYNTANLDALAANALRFTNCFAMPLSSPSRFMLMTGKYTFRNYTRWGSMNPSETTMANLLHDAGYTTCVAGRWQFDGGDASIKALGYDKYCVWDAFKYGDEEEADFGTSYKDPTIYQNGTYLGTDSILTGTYGVDVFNQYVRNFIDSNKNRPFFVYYPLPLAHAPFSPTPDDPQYANWVSKKGKSDTMYFRSMVHYMDKAIDSVVQQVKKAGLEQNTIIIFTSDNGTSSQIVSKYNYKNITGGMGSTTTYGTHVPLFVYCPGSILPGICNDFIDFTDFLPTIVGLSNTMLPVTFTTDGLSFRNRIFQPKFTGRNYLYSYFFPHPEYPTTIQREYVQDTMYKYYNDGYGFYNIANDPYELTKLNGSTITQDEERRAGAFRKVIDSIHP